MIFRAAVLALPGAALALKTTEPPPCNSFKILDFDCFSEKMFSIC